MHARDVRARLRGHELGVGAERAADTDDHGVGRVVADVDHRRQVPVDTGVAQHAADAPRLQLGLGEVAGLAEVLVRERGRPAGGRSEAHDLPALGVHRHQQRPARARARARRQVAREARRLRGVDDVTREEDDAGHARLAQEPVEIRVVLQGGPVKADEEQLAQPRVQLAEPLGRDAAAAGGPHGNAESEGEQERAGEASGHRRRRPAGARARGRRGRSRRRRA